MTVDVDSTALAHRFFEHTHRPVLRRRLTSQLLLQGSIGRAEQGSGMTGTQPAVGEQVLDPRWQRHQPQGVGDGRAALANPAGHLFVGQLEIFDELLVGSGFLQWRQILTMKVLDQGALDETKIIGVAHDGRNDRQTCSARRPPAPLAGHEFVGGISNGPDQHRLEYADLADRCGELGQ